MHKVLIVDNQGNIIEYFPSHLIEIRVEEKTSKLKKEAESLIPEEKAPEFKVYTMNEIMEKFQTSRPNIYRWIDKGWLKQTIIGGRKYFRQQDVELMLERGGQDQ